MPQPAPDPSLVTLFAVDLDALIEPAARLGIAVSGGPDSLALLLLAAAARPGQVEAATVDHALRAESRAEADMVAGICQRLGVPHAILTIDWDEPPETAIQERARAARYEALGRWAEERGLSTLVTAHHLDDQAETLVMRLNRGSGVRGLAGMRPIAPVPGTSLPLLRPLLGWRRQELEAICASAGMGPVADPSNEDERYERVRIRGALANADWLDPEALGRSAVNVAAADEALEWAAEKEWAQSVQRGADAFAYRPTDAPPEIRRRIVARAIGELANEGEGQELRGRELDRLLAELAAGRSATLRGVLCSGGETWRFVAAPPRR